MSWSLWSIAIAYVEYVLAVCELWKLTIKYAWTKCWSFSGSLHKSVCRLGPQEDRLLPISLIVYRKHRQQLYRIWSHICGVRSPRLDQHMWLPDTRRAHTVRGYSLELVYCTEDLRSNWYSSLAIGLHLLLRQQITLDIDDHTSLLWDAWVILIQFQSNLRFLKAYL